MSDLTGALPETVAAYDAMSAYLASNGITVGVADDGGVRDEADTTRILGYRLADYNHDHGLPLDTPQPLDVLENYRPINAYGTSFHNFGAAFDLAVLARPSNMSEYDALAFAGAYAPQIGLRWGGQFARPDVDHFELSIPLADAQDGYANMGGIVDDTSGGTSSSMDIALIGLMLVTVLGLVWVRRRSLQPA